MKVKAEQFLDALDKAYTLHRRRLDEGNPGSNYCLNCFVPNIRGDAYSGYGRTEDQNFEPIGNLLSLLAEYGIESVDFAKALKNIIGDKYLSDITSYARNNFGEEMNETFQTGTRWLVILMRARPCALSREKIAAALEIL